MNPRQNRHRKYIVDASFLISAIRTCDINHWQCYTFFRNNKEAEWIIPTIAYFEYQAAQSRLEREDKKAYRPIYLPNCKPYNISFSLIKNTVKLDLINTFSRLKGADLIYACIAKIERLPLVTCDTHFNAYSKDIILISLGKENTLCKRNKV